MSLNIATDRITVTDKFTDGSNLSGSNLSGNNVNCRKLLICSYENRDL